MLELNIAHLYPDLMNLYGDKGNIICLQKRIEWYGYKCTIKNIYLNDQLRLGEIDMLFMGGGSDREQELVYKELIKKSDDIYSIFDKGVPGLFICGAYQLLGNSYRTYQGKEMNGLKIFDFHTIGEKNRLIGDVLIESQLNNETVSVVGFENHGGRTFFDDENIKPFGKVIKGYGNNGKDKNEGIIFNNFIGTYLHGPLLPKNPKVTDYLINGMLENRGISLNTKLDDNFEKIANQQTKNKILTK